LVDVLLEVSRQLGLVFPIHARPMARLEAFGLRAQLESAPRLRCIEPVGHLDFLRLIVCVIVNAQSAPVLARGFRQR
jgi:UDP-N-acetylglucosamine 2-epimerase (non-hydrolysing)